jgi:hypothetical protein
MAGQSAFSQHCNQRYSDTLSQYILLNRLQDRYQFVKQTHSRLIDQFTLEDVPVDIPAKNRQEVEVEHPFDAKIGLGDLISHHLPIVPAKVMYRLVDDIEQELMGRYQDNVGSARLQSVN